MTLFHRLQAMLLLLAWLPFAAPQVTQEFFDEFWTSDYELYKEVNILNNLYITVGSLSVIGSALVLLTPVLWPSMYKGKVCMQMICMMSLCDLLTSLTVAFGFPTTNEECSIQSAISIFFCRASWFWSMLCMYILFQVVIYGHVPLTMKTMQCIVWPLNVVLELLPLTTQTYYGTTPFLLGLVMCNFSTHNPHYFLWIGSLFILPLVVATTYLMFLAVKLWRRIRHMNAGYQTALVKSVVLYPLVTLLACLPLMCCFIWMVVLNLSVPLPTTNAKAAEQWKFKYDFVSYTVAWNCSQGLCNALVFFANSGEGRERWYKLLSGYWKRFCGKELEAGSKREESSGLLENVDFLVDEEMEESIQAERRSLFNNSQSKRDMSTNRQSNRDSTESDRAAGSFTFTDHIPPSPLHDL